MKGMIMETQDFFAFLKERSKTIKTKHRDIFVQGVKDGSFAYFTNMSDEPFIAGCCSKKKAEAYKLGFKAGYEISEMEVKKHNEIEDNLIHETHGSC